MAKNKALELTIKISGKVDKSLATAISQATGQVSGIATAFSHIGTVGLAAMGALAAGTVTAFAECTEAAESFESTMADVVKYVDGLADANGRISDEIAEETLGTIFDGNTYAENYAVMTDALLDLSTQIPMTVEELAQLDAAFGQAGYSIDEIIQYDENGNITGLLRDAAVMSTAMDVSGEQAGDWMAKWENAFGMSHDEVMVLADQINYLGANSATTAAEIAEALSNSASLGQIAGADVATTAALVDAMLASGVEVARVSTAVKRTYTNMSLGSSATAAMQEQWEELGMTAEGVAKAMQEDAAGTMSEIYTAIGNLPEERQVAALSILFGNWAVEGNAKVVGNMSTFTDALAMVSDPTLYSGSMEREFIIKASTAEAIDTMMSNAFQALKIDVGTDFLPAKKEISVALIDFINQLRDMPELTTIAEQLATLFSQGVEWAGDALQKALPYIQQALDYLINHGPEVVDVLKKLALAFAAMKFAPTIEGVLGSVGSLLFGKSTGGGIGSLLGIGGTSSGTQRTGGLVGTISNLFTGGQQAGTTAGGFLSAFGGASSGNGFFRTASTAVSSLLSGNKITGTTGLLQAAAAQPGLISGYQGVGSTIANAVSGSRIGQYFSGLGTSLGGLGGSISSAVSNLGNTTIGGKIASAGSAVINSAPVQAVTGAAGKAAGFVKSLPGKAASGISSLAGAVANSTPVQAVTGLAGRVVNSAPVQAVGQFAGTALSGLGSVASSGLKVAGTALSPLLSGLGSIVSGATPVVLAISGIIAVLSLLWDNVDMLRGPIEAVFGEKGLAVFDSFKDGVSGVFDFIQGLFNGGLADVLSPLRDSFGSMLEGGGLLSTIFGGTEGGLAAFDGVVTILQSILGFIGQVVTFANETVKPVIVEIFTFITGTILPTVISIFSSAAPTISSIITSVGNIIMSVVSGIMGVVEALWPSIQNVVTVILNIAGMVIPVLLGAIDAILPVIQGIIDVIIPVVTVAVSTVGGLISGIATSIGEIVAGIVETFNGIIDFVKGVFTGNWEQAWNGVKEIFGGIWDSLVALLKTPVNAIIGIINGAISGINSLGITIPDWVPIIGGKSFSIDIPEIPMLAKGGFTSGPSIAGEAGTEAVISFQPGVRSANIATWLTAGRMLGIDKTPDTGGNYRTLDDIDTSDGSSGWFGGDRGTFSPTINITIQGNADEEAMQRAGDELEARLEAWWNRKQRLQVRTAY